MRILALDSSAKSAACAVMTGEGQLLGESFANSGYTHSKTLMPMILNLLNILDIKPGEMDLYGVCFGPGSFTGVCIGVAAVKGLAFAADKPCIGVSSLLAAAYNTAWFNGIICAVMDARRDQVYNALFDNREGRIKRLCRDRAIGIEELSSEISGLKGPVILVGDGACLCHHAFGKKSAGIFLAPEEHRLIRGSSVARAVIEELKEREPVGAKDLAPVYLRPSQAEREMGII